MLCIPIGRYNLSYSKKGQRRFLKDSAPSAGVGVGVGALMCFRAAQIPSPTS
ncbi:hypothetical protein [Pseudovibrio sp. WM33]|uniref:hypothetical protein n=1 Tax=Pseudovibrio sp. WM33 TaxID=1735585 RepID=UPI000AFF5AE6|nr:hypothetical protein [Pseudovibrio sp. WM33]